MILTGIRWHRVVFSYKYGHGRLNGLALITATQNWELMKPQAWVKLPAVQVGNG